MEKKSKKCWFKYITIPERICVNCGYHFDYIERESELGIQTKKQMTDLIFIRTVCVQSVKKETQKMEL